MPRSCLVSGSACSPLTAPAQLRSRAAGTYGSRNSSADAGSGTPAPRGFPGSVAFNAFPGGRAVLCCAVLRCAALCHVTCCVTRAAQHPTRAPLCIADTPWHPLCIPQSPSSLASPRPCRLPRLLDRGRQLPGGSGGAERARRARLRQRLLQSSQLRSLDLHPRRHQRQILLVQAAHGVDRGGLPRQPAPGQRPVAQDRWVGGWVGVGVGAPEEGTALALQLVLCLRQVNGLSLKMCSICKPEPLHLAVCAWLEAPGQLAAPSAARSQQLTAARANRSLPCRRDDGRRLHPPRRRPRWRRHHYSPHLCPLPLCGGLR